jgi:acetyl-CoA carboxylase carboxyl transferase subunit alpha
MLENAIYSILSPEGFASILWKDSSRAKEAAEIMKITAQDLKSYTIIDEIIPEPLGGAHIDKEQCIENIKQYLLEELPILQQEPVKDLLEKRYHKYRMIGEYEG